MAEQKEHWAIERKIPIALLTALAIQTGVWIWQSAAAWARLDQLEKKVEAMAPQGERLARVETKTDVLIAALAEVKDMVRQRLR
jgi:cell division protein FtsB